MIELLEIETLLHGMHILTMFLQSLVEFVLFLILGLPEDKTRTFILHMRSLERQLVTVAVFVLSVHIEFDSDMNANAEITVWVRSVTN